MGLFKIDDILDVEKYIDCLDAVVFDLDDTLYSEKEYVRSGFDAISKYYNIPNLSDDLWKSFERGEKAINVVFNNLNMLKEIETALRVYRFHKPKISLYPGVAEMLSHISRRKKIGIITDGRPEGQRNKLEALGLIDSFPFIITDELGGVEYRKPCSRAFIDMKNKLECDYCKIAYVGDNVNKDFIAPEKLGMVSIYFHNSKGLYVEK